MAIWTILFTSIHGVNYRVRVSGMSTTKTLIGGASPFITQEDDDADMFKPVRLQSGYFSIIDDGSFDWKALIPTTGTDKPVTLEKETSSNVWTPVWRGFVKPETYSGNYLERPQERQIPVQCQLSVLAGFDIEPTANTTPNFAWLLDYILNKAGTWYNIVFDGEDAVTNWLLKRVQWFAFSAKNKQGVATARYDCLTMLEEICKFMGLTARTCGTTLYFSSHKRNLYPHHIGIVKQDLTYMGSSGSQPQQWSIIQEGLFYLDSIRFTDTSNTEEIVMGVRKATVTANIQAEDTTLMNYPPESLRKVLENSSYTIYNSGGDRRTIKSDDIYNFTDYDLNGECARISDIKYASFNGEVRYEGTTIPTKEEKNWQYVINIYMSNDEIGNVIPSLLWTSKYYAFPAGRLRLSADIYRGYDKLDDACTMLVRLGIGATRISAMWFDGTNWTNSITSFSVSIGKSIGIYHEQGFGGSAGYGMQNVPNRFVSVPSGLNGYIFIDFLGSTDVPLDNNNHRSFTIDKFNLEFFPTTDNEETENEYEVQNSSQFTNETAIDTIFASENGNGFGAGIILNNDGTYCDEFKYTNYSSTSYDHPEENLAQLVSSFGEIRRQILTLNVFNTDVSNITPNDELEDSDSTFFYPLSISHEWRDEVTNIKMIQL